MVKLTDLEVYLEFIRGAHREGEGPHIFCRPNNRSQCYLQLVKFFASLRQGKAP